MTKVMLQVKRQKAFLKMKIMVLKLISMISFSTMMLHRILVAKEVEFNLQDIILVAGLLFRDLEQDKATLAPYLNRVMEEKKLKILHGKKEKYQIMHNDIKIKNKI